MTQPFLKIIAFIGVMLFSFSPILMGQKHDYVWTMGAGDYTVDDRFGRLEFDFNHNPPKVRRVDRFMNFDLQSASMCDTAGNLLFYTNGCSIANADHEMLENGDSLNSITMYDRNCPDINIFRNGTIFLPNASDNQLFDMIHHSSVFNSQATSGEDVVAVVELYYSQVDMSKNNGKGAVIQKNNLILQDSMMGAFLSAVKHSNGKDWWVITAKARTTELIRFLVTNDSIQGPFYQGIGEKRFNIHGSLGGNSVFSTDGTQLALFEPKTGLKLYEFDRSTGLATSVREVNIPNYINDIFGGIAFSPNGRYLYITFATYMFQLDTSVDSLENGLDLVAEFDDFYDGRLPVNFLTPVLGPDCRLYMTARNIVKYMHVVNNPDLPYPDNDIQLHTLELPNVTTQSLPIFQLSPGQWPGL